MEMGKKFKKNLKNLEDNSTSSMKCEAKYGRYQYIGM